MRGTRTRGGNCFAFSFHLLSDSSAKQLIKFVFEGRRHVQHASTIGPLVPNCGNIKKVGQVILLPNYPFLPVPTKLDGMIADRFQPLD